MGSEDLTLTFVLTAVSLLAVCFPLYRGLAIGLRAFLVTRRVPPAEIEQRLRQGSPRSAAVTLQMLLVLRRAVRESERQHPLDFLVDASRQYVANDYDAHFARPLSMCANILPPIGFIGTTGGLMILFLSMRLASESLELGALAVALGSSIFALLGYTFLEGLRFRLYGRLLARLDDALEFQRQASQRAQAGPA